MLMTEWEMVIAIIMIISWRVLLGQLINRKETKIGTWNWMTDWNVHKKPRMCGNVKVYQPWPWSLTEGGFQHNKTLSRAPKKGKMLANRLFCNPGVADKTPENPVSLWRPIWTLKSLECTPVHCLRHSIYFAGGETDRQTDKQTDTELEGEGGQPLLPFLMLGQFLTLPCSLNFLPILRKEELLI